MHFAGLPDLGAGHAAPDGPAFYDACEAAGPGIALSSTPMTMSPFKMPHLAGRSGPAGLAEPGLRAHVQERAAAGALQAGPRYDAPAFLDHSPLRGSLAPPYSDDGFGSQLGASLQHSQSASPVHDMAAAGAFVLRPANFPSMWASSSPCSPQGLRASGHLAQAQASQRAHPQLQLPQQGPQGPTATSPLSPGIALPDDVMHLINTINNMNITQAGFPAAIKRSVSSSSWSVAPATPPAADRPQIAQFSFSDDLANMPDALAGPQVRGGLAGSPSLCGRRGQAAPGEPVLRCSARRSQASARPAASCRAAAHPPPLPGVRACTLR
jgi:hypothetical protein